MWRVMGILPSCGVGMNARECEQAIGDLEKSLIFGGLTTI